MAKQWLNITAFTAAALAKGDGPERAACQGFFFFKII